MKEMIGHVFQLHGETTQKNQFMQTVEELAGHAALTNFKHHLSDIKRMITTIKDTIIELPLMFVINPQGRKFESGKNRLTHMLQETNVLCTHC